MKTRINELTKLVKGKSILHVGFACSPSFKERIRKGIWLHEYLINSASLCCGYDIDSFAVEVLSNEYGYKNIYSTIGELYSQHNQFDYLLLPEVIEHVDNPVSFIRNFIDVYPTSKIIITVPNAFRLRNFINAFVGVEAINSDHRYWFTPVTINKIMNQCGICDGKIMMVESYPRNIFIRMFLYLFPMFHDTIIWYV
jgi:hypothetical protein